MLEYIVQTEIMNASKLTEEEGMALYYRYGDYDEPADYDEKVFMQRLGKALPAINQIIIGNVIKWLDMHVASVKTDLEKPFGKEALLAKLEEELKIW